MTLVGCTSHLDNEPHCKHEYNGTMTAHTHKQSLTTVWAMLDPLDDQLGSLMQVLEETTVYSSWEVGKLQCFSWIKERFNGPGVQFCVIGDGMEECEAAQTMRWPFIRIDLRPDGFHRFPGLTTKMVDHYIDVIYGARDTENNHQQ